MSQQVDTKPDLFDRTYLYGFWMLVDIFITIYIDG